MSAPEILYEDNHIIVAVKPQGMPSQPDITGDADMLSILKECVRVKYQKKGDAFLGLVHRLDRPTGGVMVFARTSKAASRLCAQMSRGGFEKRYFAVAVTPGQISSSGILEDYLIRRGGANTVEIAAPNDKGAQRASLEYKVAADSGELMLLDIKLNTGRRHQIRVQLSHIGAPILGDFRYGGAPNAKLCLWAYALSFTHPTKKERMRFFCAPPDTYPWNKFEIERMHYGYDAHIRTN